MSMLKAATWTDAEIAEALDTSDVYRPSGAPSLCRTGPGSGVGPPAADGRQYRKLDGAQEARLIALACSAPPAGRARWTLQLLADQLVAVGRRAIISAECVRTTLKKTTSNRGSTSSG